MMGGGGGGTTHIDKIAEIQLQTSTYGSPVPLCIGTARVAGNIIDYDHFTPIPVFDNSGQDGGGSGGGGGGSLSISWNYQVGVIIGVCEGPATLGKVWSDKQVTSVGVPAHIDSSAAFSAEITGNLMKVHTLTSGSIRPGQTIHGAHVPSGAWILQQLSGTLYGVGNYQIIGTPKDPIVTEPMTSEHWAAATGLGLTWHPGSRSQTPDTGWQGASPSRALGYGGTCYVCHTALPLGDSSALPNHSFEVNGFLVPSTWDPAWPDAHPDEIIPFMLTDPYVSVGWEPSRITNLADGPSSYRNYCTALGLFLSPLFDEQKPASDHLQEILDATNSEPVWTSNATSMVLKIVPYGDIPASGNGAVYTPNTTPIYDLTLDDFMPPEGEDPVTVEIASQADSFNSIPIEFKDRTIDYNTSVAEDPDQLDVDMYGLRRASSTALHCIKRPRVAQIISGIKARRSVNCRNKYSFRLGWRYVLLEPMDLVTLTEPFLGLDHKVVRIISIEEDEDGYLSFVAEEWPFGVATATEFETQSGDGVALDTNADPGMAYGPVVFVAPASYSGGKKQLVIAASGGPFWGGCVVWLSDDGDSYVKAGSISVPSRHGVLTAPLPDGTDPDLVNTLSVQLADSRGQLLSVTQKNRDDLLTLSWVDSELMSYQTATLTGPAAYDCQSLRRGCYGTPIGDHDTGSPFMRVDESCLRVPVPTDKTGILYIKLQSFNVWGNALQDLADLPEFDFSLTKGMILGEADIKHLTTVYRNNRLFMVWDAVDIQGVFYEIRKGETWTQGQIIGIVQTPEFLLQADGLYWVCAKVETAHGIAISMQVSGVALYQNIVARFEESPNWLGTLSGAATIVDGKLTLASTTNFDDLPGNFDDAAGYFDYAGGAGTTGRYELPASKIIDLGTVQPSNVFVGFDLIAASIYDLMDDWPDIDSLPSIDGDYGASVSAQGWIAQAQADGVFGDWMPFASGMFVARMLKFAIDITSVDSSVVPYLNNLAVTVDMPDREEKKAGIALGSNATAITYETPFQTLPSVHIAIVGANQGDYYKLTGQTPSGFTIQLFDKNNNPITGVINWSSRGY